MLVGADRAGMQSVAGVSMEAGSLELAHPAFDAAQQPSAGDELLALGRPRVLVEHVADVPRRAARRDLKVDLPRAPPAREPEHRCASGALCRDPAAPPSPLGAGPGAPVSALPTPSWADAPAASVTSLQPGAGAGAPAGASVQTGAPAWLNAPSASVVSLAGWAAGSLNIPSNHSISWALAPSGSGSADDTVMADNLPPKQLESARAPSEQESGAATPGGDSSLLRLATVASTVASFADPAGVPAPSDGPGAAAARGHGNFFSYGNSFVSMSGSVEGFLKKVEAEELVNTAAAADADVSARSARGRRPYNEDGGARGGGVEVGGDARGRVMAGVGMHEQASTTAPTAAHLGFFGSPYARGSPLHQPAHEAPECERPEKMLCQRAEGSGAHVRARPEMQRKARNGQVCLV